MTTLGPLLASGREADVYEYGEGLVLRRYRDDRPARQVAEREVVAMERARSHGFPVPAVVEVDGADIVMERVDGPTMLDDLSRRPWRLREHARTLASLHARLHQIPAPDGLPAPYGDGHALLHRDLHPLNVILTTRGPMVIDWPNAARGDGDADVAQTWVIVATSVVEGRIDRLLALALRRLFVRTFLAPFDRTAVARLLSRVASERLTDRHLLDAERTAILRLLARSSAGGVPGER